MHIIYTHIPAIHSNKERYRKGKYRGRKGLGIRDKLRPYLMRAENMEKTKFENEALVGFYLECRRLSIRLGHEGFFPFIIPAFILIQVNISLVCAHLPQAPCCLLVISIGCSLIHVIFHQKSLVQCFECLSISRSKQIPVVRS
jgi:hypothetical protein